MRTPAFIHCYRVARSKRHGAGPYSRADALRVAIHAQFISWGCPRWMFPIIRATYKDALPTKEWLKYLWRKYGRREDVLSPWEMRTWLQRETLSLEEIAHLTYGLRPPSREP
jgi:hypothetical protein